MHKYESQVIIPSTKHYLSNSFIREYFHPICKNRSSLKDIMQVLTNHVYCQLPLNHLPPLFARSSSTSLQILLSEIPLLKYIES